MENVMKYEDIKEQLTGADPKLINHPCFIREIEKLGKTVNFRLSETEEANVPFKIVVSPDGKSVYFQASYDGSNISDCVSIQDCVIRIDDEDNLISEYFSGKSNKKNSNSTENNTWLYFDSHAYDYDGNQIFWGTSKEETRLNMSYNPGANGLRNQMYNYKGHRPDFSDKLVLMGVLNPDGLNLGKSTLGTAEAYWSFRNMSNPSLIYSGEKKMESGRVVDCLSYIYAGVRDDHPEYLPMYRYLDNRRYVCYAQDKNIKSECKSTREVYDEAALLNEKYYPNLESKHSM